MGRRHRTSLKTGDSQISPQATRLDSMRMTMPNQDVAMTASRDTVESIWRAGVQAVDSQVLVHQSIQIDGNSLVIAGVTIPRNQLRRIEVVGAGKAGAGMAHGAESALAGLSVPLSGWVNVPADCVRRLRSITLHPARPAGVNEPTPAGVAGSEEILRRVSALGPGDLCLVLISGGGSALLPAPIPGITLEDKAATIRRMSLSGAGIEDLNCVRRQLSRVKGGGLARACNAQWLITLVISDVIGDPLEVIASGPTIDFPSEPQRAWDLLQKYSPGLEGIPATVVQVLRDQISHCTARVPSPAQSKRHVAIIGNNETAVRAAEQAALKRGFAVRVTGIGQAGQAREVGRDLADQCLKLQPQLTAPLCLISGGEPVVRVEKRPGPQKGGRNQELALSALCQLIEAEGRAITILSGGTDGEDGPTDAAGAFADDQVIQGSQALNIDPRPYLDQHNSYEFFKKTNGLLKTGPTHTNVMDLRVALIEPRPVKPLLSSDHPSQPSSNL